MKPTNNRKDFQAFDMQRAFRDDPELDVYGYAFLMACTNRTDNKTCKVRASLEMLATDAKISERTVTRLLHAPEVTKYFEVIEGKTRAKNLWFYEDPTLIPVSQSGKDDSDDSSLTDDSRLPVTDSRLPVMDSRLPVTPSTYTSTSTSTYEPAIAAKAASAVSGLKTIEPRRVEPSLVKTQPSLGKKHDAAPMARVHELTVNDLLEVTPSLAKKTHAAQEQTHATGTPKCSECGSDLIAINRQLNACTSRPCPAWNKPVPRTQRKESA